MPHNHMLGKPTKTKKGRGVGVEGVLFQIKSKVYLLLHGVQQAIQLTELG